MLFIVGLLIAMLAFGVVRGEIEWLELMIYLAIAAGIAGVVILAEWPIHWMVAGIAMLDIFIALKVYQGKFPW